MDLIGQLIGINKDAPTAQKAPLDPVTQSLVNAQFEEAKKSPQEFSAQATKGIDQAVNSLGGLGGSDYGKSGTTQGYREALRNAYSGQTGDALNRIKLNSEIQGHQQKANALSMASRFALQQRQTETSYFQTLTEAYNQMEAQRAALVGAISGVANQAVGMYVGSRPKSVSPGSKTPDQSVRTPIPTYVPFSGQVPAKYDYLGEGMQNA
jgi:hypothetical protein